jgi:hypothetical protein
VRIRIIAAAIGAMIAHSGCSTPGATTPTEANATGAVPSPPTAAPAAPAPASAAPASAAPAVPAKEAPDAGDDAAGDAGEADAATEAALPDVDVKNIGMHIGGGPNDAPTKAPIKRSVAPHFDDFRRCFARVDDPKKGGDFGVDLRIEKDGGKASVTRPRTALKGEGFTQCMIEAFERIDFIKPKGGATVVSYSLRFTPK